MCFNGSEVGNWISQGNGLCANINKGIGVVSLCSSCCLLLCCPNLFCGSLVSFDIILAAIYNFMVAPQVLRLHMPLLTAHDKFLFLLPWFVSCCGVMCFVCCV